MLAFRFQFLTPGAPGEMHSFEFLFTPGEHLNIEGGLHYLYCEARYEAMNPNKLGALGRRENTQTALPTLRGQANASNSAMPERQSLAARAG